MPYRAKLGDEVWIVGYALSYPLLVTFFLLCAYPSVVWSISDFSVRRAKRNYRNLQPKPLGRPTTATAPGEVILFGEDAVVYGRLAIAVAVTDVQATATIAPSDSGI